MSAVADRRPLDDIITSLVEVSSRLEGADIAKISGPDWTLLSQITTDLVRHNPAQISYSETNCKLQQLVKGLAGGSADEAAASEVVRELASFAESRVLEAPVSDLELRDRTTLLSVAFTPYEYQPESATALERAVIEPEASRTRALVSIECVGDEEMARLSLIEQASRVLHILVGACWRLYAERGIAVPSVFGQDSGGSGLVYREADQDFDRWHAPDGDLPELLIWPDSLIFFGVGRNHLVDVLISDQPPTKSDEKLLTCLEWLGEAAGLGSQRSRFLRIAASFEALLGTRDLRDNGLAGGLGRACSSSLGCRPTAEGRNRLARPELVRGSFAPAAW